MTDKHIAQYNPMHQESRRRAEGDEVSQGIEFASEGALNAAHPRDPSVQQIENAGQQNESEGDFDWLKISIRNVSLDNFCQRHEPAKQVPGGQQIRQKINLDFGLERVVGRRLLGRSL